MAPLKIPLGKKFKKWNYFLIKSTNFESWKQLKVQKLKISATLKIIYQFQGPLLHSPARSSLI